MSNAIAKTVTQKLLNRGLDQNLDLASMTDGQLVSLLNVTSDHEGSICSKAGYKLLGNMAGYSLPHTLVKWSKGLGAADPRYFGEGQYILHTDDWASYTEVLDGLVTDLDKRWSAVAYSGGGSASTMYFATPNKMRKDILGDGTTLTQWGLFAPTRPPTCALQAADNVSLYAGPTGAVAINSTTAYTDVLATSSPVTSNLGQFAATIPSGSAETFYDSDDYIELDLAITGLTASKRLGEVRVELDTGAGTWVNYYSKAIMPSTMSNYTQQIDTAQQAAQEQSQLADQDVYDPYRDKPYEEYSQSFNYSAPVYLAPYSTSSTEHLKIRKSEFLKVGAAGTSSYNWSQIQRIRVTAVAASLDGGTGPSVEASNIKMVGGSGPDSSSATARGYKYLFSYRDPDTRQESNPCVPMVDERRVYPTRQPVRVTCAGTAQVGTSKTGSIAVYRAGGSFADEYYRLVGYAINPGTGSTVNFDDRSSDEDIRSARTVSYDNDPPVPSPLRVPLVAEVSAGVTGDGSGAQTWTVANSTITNLTTAITVGTLLTVNNGANSEQCRVEAVGAASVTVYCQRKHVAHSATNPLTVSAEVAAGKACFLSALVGDSIYLAGDDVNPDLLYKSANGRPESFPFASGPDDFKTVLQMRVGSAANPIMNITEFGGVLVCLNKNAIYTVGVWSGVPQAPQATPAQRGLFARHAWCKANNEIWYVAHDGVYSWSGGVATLRSRQIQWMFRNRTVNGIAPINMAGAPEYLKMKCAYNKVFLTYKDTGSATRRVIYDLATDRWEMDDYPFLTMEVMEDTGEFIVAKYDAGGGYVYSDGLYGTTGTTLGWTGTDGVGATGIAWNFKTGAFNLGAPDVRKLFTSLAVEITKPSADAKVTVKVYYDYSASAGDTFVFGNGGGSEINIGTGRMTVPLPLQQAGSPATSTGKEAKCFALEFIGDNGTKIPTQIHSITCVYMPLEREQRGDIYDWNDAGHPWDKRLQEVVVDYDTTGVTAPGVKVFVDALEGIGGATYNDDVMNFTLAPGRGQISIPATDGIIGKKFRLRTETAAYDDNYVIFDVKFVAENYPADIVKFTPWSTLGHIHDKRFFALSLWVDTNNKAVPIDIEVDGVAVDLNGASGGTSVNVTATEANRVEPISIPIDIVGKQVRIKVGTIPADGKFQLFDHKFEFEPYPPDVVYGTDWSDYGHPYQKRLYTLAVNADTNGKDVPVTVEADGSSTQAAFTVNGTAANRLKPLSFDVDITGRLLRLKVGTIPADGKFQLFGHKFGFEALPPDTVESTEYSDYGHPFEKRVTLLWIAVDTGGQDASVIIEGDGATKQTVTVNGTYATRMIQKPVTLDVVAKQLRLKVTPHASGKFQLYSHRFDFEKLPPETVYSTDYDEYGAPFVKFINQLAFEVNTGGLAVPVGIFGDGVLKQTVSVNGTLTNRQQIITLNSQLTAKQIRIQVDPATMPLGSRFQLFDFKPMFQNADKGPVGHSVDWSAMDWPHDKELKQVAFEYETGGSTVTIVLDTISGLNGNTINSAVQTFTVQSTGRGFKTVALNDRVCKMARLRSLGTDGAGTHPVDFKMWNVTWQKENRPPDITYSTPEEDLGWGCDKLFRGVSIEVDTGSVACTVRLEIDGVVKDTWTITTTDSDRVRYLTPNVETEISGKLYRLTLSAGANGKSQVYKVDYTTVRDACEFRFLDSFEQAFGSVGFRYLRQIWLDYRCSGQVYFRIYNSDGDLFWEETLPAQAVRQPYRFYLPTISNGILNKSSKHRFQIEAADSTKPVKIYRDSSRCEYHNLSGEARQGFNQAIIWSGIPLPV
jgi:hypothetical protein